MQGSVEVEQFGDVVIARVRGEPSTPLLSECHERVLALLRATGCKKVLYDARELTAPEIDLVVLQRQMVDAQDVSRLLQRAIVVSNARLAYLTRMAFGERDYRIFYNDMASAMKWLET